MTLLTAELKDCWWMPAWVGDQVACPFTVKQAEALSAIIDEWIRMKDMGEAIIASVEGRASGDVEAVLLKSAALMRSRPNIGNPSS